MNDERTTKTERKVQRMHRKYMSTEKMRKPVTGKLITK